MSCKATTISNNIRKNPFYMIVPADHSNNTFSLLSSHNNEAKIRHIRKKI